MIIGLYCCISNFDDDYGLIDDLSSSENVTDVQYDYNEDNITGRYRSKDSIQDMIIFSLRYFRREF